MTLKVAWPAALVVAETAVMVEWPAPWPRLTTWPETGVPEASSSVTVMVDVAVPLSATEVGEATVVEVAAETGPWKVIDPGVDEGDPAGHVVGAVGVDLGVGVGHAEGGLTLRRWSRPRWW